MTSGSLTGVRIIDLTRVLGGPYCTQILGDHGAEVIKIEPPQGDETRDWGPPFRDATASYFVGVNRNKRTLALDLGRDSARAALLRLLDGADVLIHNYKTGTLERWGLGYDDVLAKRFPRLVYCHVTGFGNDGPLGGLPGYDAAVQACAGLMSINGTEASGPLRMGTPLVDLGTGLYAALGIMMALHERARSGRGQAVDVSLYDSAIALMHPQPANYLMSGQRPRRLGNAHPNIAPYDSFATGTKPIFLAVGNDRQFQRLCQALDAPALATDPRFLTNGDRSAHRDALRSQLEGLLATLDGVALADRLQQLGVPCGAVLDIPEVLDHPHTRHRAMLVEEGDYRGLGIPVHMSRTPGSVRTLPRGFNQDGEAILREAGLSDGEIAALRAQGALVDRRRRGGE